MDTDGTAFTKEPYFILGSHPPLPKLWCGNLGQTSKSLFDKFLRLQKRALRQIVFQETRNKVPFLFL